MSNLLCTPAAGALEQNVFGQVGQTVLPRGIVSGAGIDQYSDGYRSDFWYELSDNPNSWYHNVVTGEQINIPIVLLESRAGGTGFYRESYGYGVSLGIHSPGTTGAIIFHRFWAVRAGTLR